jgi:hypothetical protein
VSKARKERIPVPHPPMVRVTVLIEGITPLVVHRFDPNWLQRLRRRSPCLVVAREKGKQ